MKNEFLFPRILSISNVLGSRRMLAILIPLLCVMAGNAFAQTVAFEWVKAISGSEDDYGRNVVADRMGNVYMAGYYNSSALDFNPGGSGGAVTNAGDEDVFLVKYDAGGNLLWVKNIGGDTTENINGLAIDEKTGSVIMTGSFNFKSTTLDFNPGGSGGTVSNAGDADIYVAKYDTSGNFLWAKSVGGSGSDIGSGVAADSDGNVFVTGYYSSASMDFNPGGAGGSVTNLGSTDIFLVKYDSSGNFLWSKSMGGIRTDMGNAIAVDGIGNVYITGRYGFAISPPASDFNPGGAGGTITPVGNIDVYIAKYDAGGNFRWVKGMGGSNMEYALGITADAIGNVYFTGWYQSNSIDFNIGGTGGSVTKLGTNNNAFLAAYDSAGNFRWVNNLGGSGGYTQGLATIMSGMGNVYVTGWSTVPVPDFDLRGGNPAGALQRGGTSTSNTAAFLAEYDTSGNFLSLKGVAGTTGSGVTALTPGAQGYGAACDGLGNVYMTGWFRSGAAEFNLGGTGGSLTSVNEDGFLVKYACNDTSSSYIADSTCAASYTLNGSVYTASGTYVQHFPNAVGCDSVVTLDLILTPIAKPLIDVNQLLLSAIGTYATYQWIKNDTLIPGATANTYTVTSNGNYRLAVTNDKGCTDTSDVYSVTNVAVNDIHAVINQIRIYPNPAEAVVYINSPVKVNIHITDMAGRLIKTEDAAVSIPIAELAPGAYLLNIISEEGAVFKTEKLIKLK